MNKIRLGFVGAGSMGQAAHLRNYIIHPECEVVALAELRPQLARAVAARYGIPRVYPDHNEMLSNEKLDGIVAVQPYKIHGGLIPELLKAGVPVLAEKPLARSVESGEIIEAASRESGVPVYFAYHKRSDPATLHAMRTIREWRESGIAGRLNYIRITMPPGLWDWAGFSTLIKSEEPYPKLAEDPAPAGMNAASEGCYDWFVNYYIHQVNLMRHLLGEDYQVTYADPSGRIMAVQSGSGITGILEMAPYNTPSRDWQESALVAFERGWIRIDFCAPLVIDQASRITICKDPKDGTPETSIPSMPPVHAMRQQAGHFLQAIRSGKTCLCEAPEALKDLRTASQYLEKFESENAKYQKSKP